MLLATPTSRSRSGGTASWKTGSTWVTWSGGRPAVRLLRHRRVAGRTPPTRWANVYAFPRISHACPGFDPSNPTSLFKSGTTEPQLPEPARAGVVPGDRPDQLPAVVRAPGAGAGLRADPAAASTPTSASPTPTTSTAPTSTSARRSPSSSASGTPSATTWCSTSRPTTRTSCRTRPAAWCTLYDPSRAGATATSGCCTNADFGNVRGIDVRLDRRFGNLFNGTLAYTFQEAKNTGSDPFTYINFGSRILNQRERRQRPAAAGHPDHQRQPAAQPGRLVGAHLPERLEEGHHGGHDAAERRRLRDLPVRQRHAYTGCPIATERRPERAARSATVAPGRDRRTTSTAPGCPTFKQFDLRLTKGFGLGGLDLTAYARHPQPVQLQEHSPGVRGQRRRTGTRPSVGRTFRQRPRRTWPPRRDSNPGAVRDDWRTGAVDLTACGLRAPGCSGPSRRPQPQLRRT